MPAVPSYPFPHGPAGEGEEGPFRPNETETDEGGRSTLQKKEGLPTDPKIMDTKREPRWLFFCDGLSTGDDAYLSGLLPR